MPMDAYRALFQAVRAIPVWHFVVAMVVFSMAALYHFLESHLFEDLLTGFRGSTVSLTYNSGSDVYHKIASKCGTLRGRYLATPWLSSPHLQTIFVNSFGRPPVFDYRREIFHASDGGTLALDWLTPNTCSSDITPIVIAIPGLASDSTSPYLKHLAHGTANRGWNVVICNHMGMGGLSLTSDRIYNAGSTQDIRSVVEHLHRTYPAAPLFLVGTSLGASAMVKYLGEDGENVPISGAVAICSPWDLLMVSRFFSCGMMQKFYDRALSNGLRGYAKKHKPRFQLANWDGIKTCRSLRDYHRNATCLVEDYETVDAFYRHCSSSTFVGRVAVPLLCIGSFDDPLCTVEALPWDECRANKNVVLAMAKHGGHLGFFEGIGGSRLWWVKAANEFLGVLHSSPLMHKRKDTTAKNK